MYATCIFEISMIQSHNSTDVIMTFLTLAILTITGYFRPEPFEVAELKSPSQEVPLISVKVANKGEENVKAKNEPFGQSGTRCTLFDPTTEEPIGVSKFKGSWFVRQFKCQISGQREGGRYNMSVISSLPCLYICMQGLMRHVRAGGPFGTQLCVRGAKHGRGIGSGPTASIGPARRALHVAIQTGHSSNLA